MKGQNINLSFNMQEVYTDCNFNINEKDKVGVVGVNGAGKTTLFKVILGEQQLSSGKISIGDKQIGYLPQEIIIDNSDITVSSYLLSARPIEKLEQELASLYEIIIYIFPSVFFIFSKPSMDCSKYVIAFCKLPSFSA